MRQGHSHAFHDRIHIFKYDAQAGIKVIQSHGLELDPEDRQHQLNLESDESDDKLPAA